MHDQGILFLALAGIIGLCVGSFLNVVIYRLPRQLEASWKRDSRDFLGLPAEEDATATFNIAIPTSHCPKCNAPLSPWHNIPLLSYLFLRGRCAACAAPISAQYPLVEFCSGALFAIVGTNWGITAEGGFILVFGVMLLTLTVIDFHTHLLPDILTYPLLWLGLLANTQGLFTSLTDAVYGAVAGYMILWMVYWAFKLLTGKEGMGHGDFKLLAALGAWLGWQQLPLIILLSSFVGAAIGLAMIVVRGRDKQLPMAFGPYLAIAGFIAMFWGEAIVSSYLGMLG